MISLSITSIPFIAITGRLPFTNIMLHGVVCDGQGRKMSKSLGNVIDPLHVIQGRSLIELEEDLKVSGGTLMTENELKKAVKELKTRLPNGIPTCGTDALRFSLMHNDPTSQQINIDVQFVSSCAAFCNKIWQVARFFLQSHERLQGGVSSENGILEGPSDNSLGWLTLIKGKLKPEDQWILSRCGTTVSDVNGYFESRDFHLAARSLRTFLYSNLCDVYVEAAKPVLSDVTNSQFQVKYEVLRICLNTALKLLHPIMPFMTEELYQRIRVLSSDLDPPDLLNESIMTSEYPRSVDWDHLVSRQIMDDMDIIQEIVTSIRNSKSLYDLKRAIKPNVCVISEVTTSKSLFYNNELVKEYCDLISVLSPCGNVDIFQECHDCGSSKNYPPINTWSSTEIRYYNSTVYVDVSGHLNLEKELQKNSMQQAKLLKDFESLKKKKEKKKETVSNIEIEKYNLQIKRLSDKQTLLNQRLNEHK